MHTYIDMQKKNDFSEMMSIQSIAKDLRRLNIQNMYDDGDDEVLYFVAETLYEDYKLKRANYKAYVEPYMNMRMLAELRKSAVLKWEETAPELYAQHQQAETVQDVKDIRIRYFSKLNADYIDADWQYALIAKCYLREETSEYYFDLEDCFADSKTRKPKGIRDYIKDFAEAHLQGCKYDFSTYWPEEVIEYAKYVAAHPEIDFDYKG